MANQKISKGIIHTVPVDLQKILISKPKVLAVWEDISSIARNEWVCWIISAKKPETRDRRIKIMCENLLLGKRRPCCWAGCNHR